MSNKEKVIVNKFGGGIMIPEFIHHAKQRIEEQIAEGKKPVVVVSALKGITDELITFYNLLNKKVRHNQQIGTNSDRYVESLIEPFIEKIKSTHIEILEASKVKEVPMKEFDEIFDSLKNDYAVITRFGGMNIIHDKITSYGEKLSSLFFTIFLNANNISAKRYIAEDVPILTDNNHLDADIIYDESVKNIQEKLNLDSVAVIPGFTGRSEEGNITTLGRGGTDTTACFVGAALQSEKVILWKDVAGVLSADPRIVPAASTVPYVSYEEAEESGKVIHDKAIQYVKMHELKAEVASILDYQKKTTVGPALSDHKGAKMVGFKKGLSLALITDDGMGQYGFLYNITKILKTYQINMALIRNTRDSLYIVVEKDNGNLDKAIKELEEHKYKLDFSDVNMVSLIGSLDWRMVNDFNDALVKICPDPQVGAFPYKNCVRLEAIVKTDDMKMVMRELHKVFIK